MASEFQLYHRFSEYIDSHSTMIDKLALSDALRDECLPRWSTLPQKEITDMMVCLRSNTWNSECKQKFRDLIATKNKDLMKILEKMFNLV